jgi:hypothetical protein
VSRRLSVGPLPALANALYAWDTLALDGDEFLTRNTFTVSLALVEGEGNLTQIFARFQNKDFAKTTEPRQVRQEERDANNWMAGFLHFVRFAQDKHFVKAGWQLDYDDTGGANYEYVGHRFSVGARARVHYRELALPDLRARHEATAGRGDHERAPRRVAAAAEPHPRRRVSDDEDPLEP